MTTFPIPKPSDIKPDDRSSFDHLWKDVRAKHRHYLRQLLWLRFMDQLVEGSASIDIYERDIECSLEYEVGMELLEEFKAKGFQVDTFWSGSGVSLYIGFKDNNAKEIQRQSVFGE